MGEPAFADWVGRSSESVDVVAPGPVRRLAATLGDDAMTWPDQMLPPLGHWLFHLPVAAREELGRDGHPALGGFMPPIPYPRRMWAGGRVRFHAPVPIGATLTKRTTIRAITAKPGMTFVTLHHDLRVADAAAIEEEQDLVYLPLGPAGPARPVERPAATHQRRTTIDEALLFRFSALTFNAHRIHYDLPYAREVEGYPALVVHGPLQAMLLLGHAVRGGGMPIAFAFRARAPLHVGGALTIASAGRDHWIVDTAGVVTMTAEVDAR